MKKIVLVCIAALLLWSGNAAASTVWSGIFQPVYGESDLVLDRLDFYETGLAVSDWQLSNDGGNSLDFFVQKWLAFVPGDTFEFALDSSRGTWKMPDGVNEYSGTFTGLSFSGTSTLIIVLDSWQMVESSGDWLPGNGIASVSAVPVPGAVWLFGSGILGLLCLRRKA